MKRYFLNLEVDAQTPVDEPAKGAGWTWCVWDNGSKGAWFWADQLTLYPFTNDPEVSDERD